MAAGVRGAGHRRQPARQHRRVGGWQHLLERASGLSSITAAIETGVWPALDEVPAPLVPARRSGRARGRRGAMLAAVPPLARVQRYGDVRRTDTGVSGRSPGPC